jgi:signal transduction histidine kinase
MFSVVVFRLLSMELDRMGRAQRVRIERQFPQLPQTLTPQMRDMLFPPEGLDKEVIQEVQQRILINLITINLIILAGSATAGYFLAGKTLQPIKQMMDDQNQFITDASHELRTPITALKAEIEVTLRDKHLSDVEMKKILMSNLEEVNHLQALTDGLITLSRAPANHRDIPVSEVAIQDVVLQAIQKVESLAKKRQITITHTEAPLLIHGEIVSLVELLVIFLDNAIKYSPKRTTVSIAVHELKDKKIAIAISDQGVGIEAKDVPHIFDRFYQADKSRSKIKVKGFGLGLSIAKQIVTKYRGTVSVTSTIGNGSTFTIVLPIKQKQQLI